jgi:GT2 family glycosyltransferase
LLEIEEYAMESPFVSIIIITRSRPFLLKHCLERVFDQSYPQKEVIVVDSSPDDESEPIVAQYPEAFSVRLRGQRNNMPQARNEGMAVAHGDIIAFIDDDSMISFTWLQAMVDIYQDETVGAAGGRITRKPEPYCDQESGTPLMLVKSSGMVIAKGFDLLGETQVEVDHLVGCNMSFRRKALQQVGGFDAQYTLTNVREETDIFIRLKKASWRIMFVPAMSVKHVSARSAKPFFMEQPYIQFSYGRNSAYLAFKNFGFNFHTLTGQLVEIGLVSRRAAYLAGLAASGLAAQLAGRAVGLVVGISWHVSNKRDATAVLKLKPSVQATGEPGIVTAVTSKQTDGI